MKTERLRISAGAKATCAAFAVYMSVLYNFLVFNQYPVIRAEVLYTAAVGAICAAIFGLSYQLSGFLPNRLARLVRAMLVALIVVYAVGLIATSTYGLVAGAVVFILTLVSGIDVLKTILLISAGALLAAVIGIGQDVQAPLLRSGEVIRGSQTEPAIVHIILDAHIGPEGLPKDNFRSQSLKRDLQTFFIGNRFRLFGGAYTRFNATGRSIPFISNFAQGTSAKNNAYFHLLKTRGYSINVYQSEWIDYCSGLVSLCTTYESQNYAVVANAPLSAQEKAIFLIWKMLPSKLRDAALQTLATTNGNRRSYIPLVLLEIRPTPLNSLAAFRRFEHDLAGLEPGEIYFAHFLLPHSPYGLRADCSVRPIREWRQQAASYALSERQDAYAEQASCVLRELERVLAAVESSRAARNTIIIVHGDHGSRITDVEPGFEKIGKFGDKELIASYSTLFAVRGPAIVPGYDARHYPVADLLRELAISNFQRTASHPVREPEVNLIDQSWQARRRVRMPEDW